MEAWPGYHKIQSLYKRDPETNYKTFLKDQYVTEEFELLANRIPWTCQEKIDGTNMRALLWLCEKGHMQVEYRGRTDKAELHGGVVGAMAEKFEDKENDWLKDMLESYEQMVFFGEGFGGKIQSGSLYGEQDFCLFDVLALSNRGTGWFWMDTNTVESFAGALGFKFPEIICVDTLDVAEKIVQDGFESKFGSGMRAEGLVCRPVIPIRDQFGGRIITKMTTVSYEGF